MIKTEFLMWNATHHIHHIFFSFVASLLQDTANYDQRPFAETVRDAIIANDGVKNRQKGAKHLQWQSHQTRFRF